MIWVKHAFQWCMVAITHSAIQLQHSFYTLYTAYLPLATGTYYVRLFTYFWRILTFQNPFQFYVLCQNVHTCMHYKDKLVVLTTEWLPSCRQTGETVAIGGSLLILKAGRYKTWTLNSELDYGLDLVFWNFPPSDFWLLLVLYQRLDSCAFFSVYMVGLRLTVQQEIGNWARSQVVLQAIPLQIMDLQDYRLRWCISYSWAIGPAAVEQKQDL